MTSEAVLRGIPTISYNAIPNDDERYLVKKGLVKRAKNNSEIIELTTKFLKSGNNSTRKKAKQFLSTMEDPYIKLEKVLSSLKK